MNEFILIPTEMIASVIGTLKMIDVRGYENMDRLVGCVITLEKAMQQGGVTAVPNGKEKVEEDQHEHTEPYLDQDGVKED